MQFMTIVWMLVGLVGAGAACDGPGDESPPPETQLRDGTAEAEVARSRGEAEPSPCHTGPLRPASVQLAWERLPSPASEATLGRSELTLRVENVDASALEIRPISIGFIAGRRTIHELPALRLDGRTSAEIVVSLDPGEVDWSSVKSSAHLYVIAEVIGASGRTRERAHSPVVYFHEADGAMLAYGEQAMRERHGRGDIRGLYARIRDDEHVIAIVDNGAGLPIEDIGSEVAR